MSLCGKIVFSGFMALALLASPVGVAGGAADQQDEATASEEQDPRTYGLGLANYQRYCRTCHGPKGKGDGKIVQWLKVPPTDLTRLSAENDGVFPEERVRRSIDGREEVALHGERDMPIWGNVLQDPAEGGDQESQAQAKITALVHYLRQIQAPGESED